MFTLNVIIGEIFGEAEFIVVPDSLLQELAALRVSYAFMLSRYKKELQNNSEAQENFIEIVPTVIGRALSLEHNFQAYYDILVNEEISLFNVTYLLHICVVFPDEIW